MIRSKGFAGKTFLEWFSKRSLIVSGRVDGRRWIISNYYRRSAITLCAFFFLIFFYFCPYIICSTILRPGRFSAQYRIVRSIRSGSRLRNAIFTANIHPGDIFFYFFYFFYRSPAKTLSPDKKAGPGRPFPIVFSRGRAWFFSATRPVVGRDTGTAIFYRPLLPSAP